MTTAEADRVAHALLGALQPDVADALRRAVRGAGAASRPSASAPIRLPSSADKLRDKAWLEAEYAARSAQQIAVDLGCNAKTVLAWLRKHDIERRSPADASRIAYARARPANKTALLVALKEWAAAHDGFAPTITEWESSRQLDDPSEKSARAWFGSWGAAIEAAGLPPRRPGIASGRFVGRRDDWNRTALLQGLRAWAAEHDGESPTLAEWDASRPSWAPSERTARRMFGGWNKALEAAGLPLRPAGVAKRPGHATPGTPKPGRNRQMVTGQGLDDRLPGTVKHFGEAA